MTDTRFESARGEVFVPSVWRPFYEQTSIPAAVRAGDTLRVTGHTGDNADGVYSEDVEDQIRTTFSNVAMTLAAAGAGWSDVVEIHSYHVGLRDQARAVLGVAAEFLDALPCLDGSGRDRIVLAEGADRDSLRRSSRRSLVSRE